MNEINEILNVELEKIIEKELRNYKVEEIEIKIKKSGIKYFKKYHLYIVPEFCDEDLNVFDGVLLVKTEDRREFFYFKTWYKPPVSGYAPRLVFIFCDDYLLIKDYRRNKYIIKKLKKINKTFLSKLKKILNKPDEKKFNQIFLLKQIF